MVEPQDIKENAIYWTCKQSMESEGYGEYSPRKPWRAKLRIVQRNGGTVLYLYAFDRETGEIDDDTNASCVVDPKDFFLTQEEAIEQYKRDATDHAHDLIREAVELLDNVRDIKAKP